ncbi:response regulator transcription factor [Intestinibacillus sp. Marseille-P6563]|uniref:response regulator transcription factor n=1 Tax=Intestinibacillus sp. Marseille-P6563 TaxID=2364792 RepID=UPI000F06E604|nr:response regulator transcription factor [Intestinibacillus sp. Marseille-P6563]
MEYQIMIVEDDPDIAELLSLHLQKFGFSTHCCQDFSNVFKEFEEIAPHLVLLDINLPAYDGFYWCGKLRAKSPCPIIFLSSRNADSDQVYAMMNGGDDFVTKPFSLDVITAKITALLRRTYGEYAVSYSKQLQCGDCTFSQNRLTLACNGKEVELSKTEAGVLRVIFEKYPDVASREELLSEIWDDETFVEENTLNVTISRIRRRLEQVGSRLVVKSVRGVGYRIGELGHER